MLCEDEGVEIYRLDSSEQSIYYEFTDKKRLVCRLKVVIGRDYAGTIRERF